ncbi:MFS transporter [Desulfatiglans anilini]|uniref:MFS transporter n=1 Tax=Desulfatiglans anilini TaxID=90728 RepID=UPI00054F2A27|nr:MFS transporter [Desulfatiglans anilini]
MVFPFRIFLTLFSAVFVTTMGAGLVAPLLPVYAHELGAEALEIGLIFGSFSLTRSLFVPYFGKWSDRRGRKPFIVIGLFGYFLVSLAFTATEGVWSLIAIRLAQGFASAMVLPVAQAYVGDMTPSGWEGRMMGVFNIALYFGLSAGPVLGGVLRDWAGIDVSFLSMGALALFGFLLSLILLPREKSSRTKEAAAAKSGSERPVGHGYSTLLKRPAVRALFLFRATFTTAIGITWTFLPLGAGTRLGLSSSAIGFVVMVNVLVAALCQAPMGYLADRISKGLMVGIGGVMGAGAMLFLSEASTFWGLVLANSLFGLAGGIAFPPVMALGVIEGRAARAMGSLMGLLALAHSLGMLAGPVLGGFFIDWFSFDWIFRVGAGIIALGTLIFWMQYKR